MNYIIISIIVLLSLVGLVSIIKMFLERNNKFYVVIEWGNGIPNEHRTIESWNIQNGMLGLHKRNSKEAIVLDKVRRVVIFRIKTISYPNISKDKIFIYEHQ